MAAITAQRSVVKVTRLGWFSGMGMIVRRELRDTFRDWRMITPIVLLTLFFPVLMTVTANVAQNFVERYGTPLLGERLIPFLMLIVGFFPMSFSLVIALEAFVGERERKSLEPLLSTPLTDGQLYVGKMIASLVPALMAAFLGIGVYLSGLFLFRRYVPEPILLAQVLALTTMEGVVMVAGAVVVSTRATSVRAANLLASFIIIPMALLVQVEAIILFQAIYDAHVGHRAGLAGGGVDLDPHGGAAVQSGRTAGPRDRFDRSARSFPAGGAIFRLGRTGCRRALISTRSACIAITFRPCCAARRTPFSRSWSRSACPSWWRGRGAVNTACRPARLTLAI